MHGFLDPMPSDGLSYFSISFYLSLFYFSARQHKYQALTLSFHDCFSSLALPLRNARRLTSSVRKAPNLVHIPFLLPKIALTAMFKIAPSKSIFKCRVTQCSLDFISILSSLYLSYH